ncbi:MAG: NAD(P)(+) transhydrogenase (Re/Si-specific) subunit beta [Lutibacter sp.]|jgi:NAD(P) transhydrogenase subunit beta|uniref:NAD(P)(+) transhydrogenase (Re/Si-specific) subunit beta n=1 Tax=Lutibacter sp. TaxID=1925666 RepID=UPI0018389CD1|nr:NAD(P)(+) transhydrogenase (Re/Si-specific) subunit beta [Lutibacter sp.]MBT8316116.1 NAD(P)(+) transhydrogenase (Re/Si-specific) subunit beta [Lutibacter sp.]NNJ56976.1 NAD(P)(+) transhydrogenase (Re/Si-specific) subunit beta [Lutibacter sp.]
MSITLSIIYLISTITFVIGLKMLGHPETAKKGNFIAAVGMVLAIIGTIFLHDFTVSNINYILIGAALFVGSLIGWLIAMKVEMTKMPELVSLFNGFGGASAMLIGLVEYGNNSGDIAQTSTVIAAIIIGSITFSGSLVAFGKLNGSLKDIRLPKYNLINNVLFLGLVAFGAYIVMGGASSTLLIYALLFASLIYGLLFVFPIGGADMPVVISLLNSLTGIAAAITGVLYGNMVMLVGGILVGSAGLILTFVMCEGMNRSLSNVIFGAFGGDAVVAGATGKTGGTIKKTTASDSAVLLNYANKVVIVPGYGLAVAQAQHVIHELEQVLTEKGVDVSYAIHPVAGRMPGHMNVLLAESNVDYDKLIEMDDINPQFPNTDVVLVVGANDVVNPAAHNDPSSPIYGMPILDVENSKHIIVNKRTMNAGYAGIQNELFFNTKTSMLFGDAKSALTELVSELKNM